MVLVCQTAIVSIVIMALLCAQFDLRRNSSTCTVKMVNIENIDSLPDLLKAIYGAWEEIKAVLGEAFPDMQPEDWEHVRVKELYPTIRDILKFSIMEIAGIPSEGKN